MNLLVVIEGRTKGQRFFIDKPVVSLGRALENDIVIEDEGASRFHSRIVAKEEEISLLDLDSRNGTFVNNRRVTSCVLHNGDRVVISDTVLLFKSKESPADTTTVFLSEADKVRLTPKSTMDARQATILASPAAKMQAAENFAALYEFVLDLSSLTYVDKLLATAFTSLLKHLPVDRVVVILADKNGETQIAGSHLREGKVVNRRINISKSLIKQIIETGQSLLSANEMPVGKPVAAGPPEVSYVACAPLKAQDKTVGLIYCDTFVGGPPFTEDHLRLLTAMAIEIGLSLENARLYEQLMNSIEYNECILRNIGSGLVVVDNTFHVTNINDTACTLLDLDRTKTLGLDISTVPHLKPLHTLVHKTLETGIPCERGEMDIMQESGVERPLGASTSILENFEGEEIGVIVSFRDLTRIKKLQDEVKKTQRLAALGEMAASVAHEIRNPLNSIRGFVELLSETVQGEQEQTYTGVIISEVDRLDSIIRELLDFAKDKEPVMNEIINLNDLVRQIEIKLKLDITDSQVEWNTELDKDLPTILGNSDKLIQVLINLVKNALQATEPGKQVTVRTEVAHIAGEIYPRAALRVIDTGTGMSPETVQKIFEPFYTEKAHGTGLGLPISQKIVEQHRGQISVESELGKGSAFSVVLPVVKQ